MEFVDYDHEPLLTRFNRHYLKEFLAALRGSRREDQAPPKIIFKMRAADAQILIEPLDTPFSILMVIMPLRW